MTTVGVIAFIVSVIIVSILVNGIACMAENKHFKK